MKTKTCPSCKKEIPALAKRCRYCKAEIDSSSSVMGSIPIVKPIAARPSASQRKQSKTLALGAINLPKVMKEEENKRKKKQTLLGQKVEEKPKEASEEVEEKQIGFDR